MTIHIKLSGMEEVKRILDPTIYKKITSRALNRVVSSAKTVLSKDLRQRYNINKSRIDEAFIVKTSSPSRLEAFIVAKGSTPGLQHYAMKILQGVGNRNPITVEVLKGSRQLVQGGFFVKRLDSIFMREKTARKSKNKQGKIIESSAVKIHLKRLFGPSVPGMVNVVGLKSVEDTVNSEWEKRFDHELDFELKKRS